MVNFRIFLFIILCSPTLLFSQVYEIEEVAEDDEIVEIPFAVIEKVPLYPGCSGKNNSELRKCTSDNISSFIQKKLNKKKLLKNLNPDTYKVYSAFKINEKGEIENIRVRTSDNIIEQELIKVLNKMPTLTPGQQRGKVIGVLYSLGIKFEIDGDHKFSFL